MSNMNDIRAALEQAVTNVSGFPSDRAWENVRFEPTTGTPWARMVLNVALFYPEATGPAAADAMADAVRDAFTVSTVANEGSVSVRFDYSERGQGVPDSPWYQVPVRVRWYTYLSS